MKKRTKYHVTRSFLSLATLILVLDASAKGEVVFGDLGRKVDEYISRLEKFGFSGAVLVAKDGQVALNKGYGLADRAKNVPFSTETVCSIGSITKQFTAAGILKLEMQGKLHVTDPISRYLPNVPEDKKEITIHHLLTHSAGLRGDFGGRDSDPISRDDLVKLVLAEPLEAPPGKRYEYSNEGYSLLGAIVERVSGQTYENFLYENLFRPAGMEQTGYVRPKWPAGAVAHGYINDQDWGTIPEKGWRSDGPGWYLKANGGLHSTTGDMYKWHMALEGEVVLSKEAKVKYFTPHIAEGPRGLSHYGYGWAISTTPRKTRLIAHNGGNGVFAADFRRYVDENVVIYAASNAGITAIDLTEVLPSLVFGGKFVMPPPSISMDRASLDRYAGTYQLENGKTIEVSSEQHGLVFSGGADAFALLNFLSPPGKLRFAEAEARTVSMIEAAAHGDYRPIHAAFGGRVPLEEVEAKEHELWQQRRERFGEFKTAETIGTGLDGPGITVYVRVVCERGGPVARYFWDEGKLVGIQMMPKPPERIFIPESSTKFNAFDIRQSVPLTVRFALDPQGRSQSLALVSPDGDIQATRK